MKTMLLSASLLALATPVVADITVRDAYARAASPAAKSGAAFMVLENDGAEDDRLLAVSSDAAVRVELHTHAEDATGMMVMSEVEEGFAVPAGGTHILARGGDHVMFLGLKDGWDNGDAIPVTLSFEKAGDMMVEILVDNDRMPDGHAASHGH